MIFEFTVFVSYEDAAISGARHSFDFGTTFVTIIGLCADAQ